MSMAMARILPSSLGRELPVVALQARLGALLDDGLDGTPVEIAHQALVVLPLPHGLLIDPEPGLGAVKVPVGRNPALTTSRTRWPNGP